MVRNSRDRWASDEILIIGNSLIISKNANKGMKVGHAEVSDREPVDSSLF